MLQVSWTICDLDYWPSIAPASVLFCGVFLHFELPQKCVCAWEICQSLSKLHWAHTQCMSKSAQRAKKSIIYCPRRVKKIQSPKKHDLWSMTGVCLKTLISHFYDEFWKCCCCWAYSTVVLTSLFRFPLRLVSCQPELGIVLLKQFDIILGSRLESDLR